MLKNIIIVFMISTVTISFAQTEEVEYQYDPDNGDDINQLCAGCHGEFGEGGGDGEYPRLAGLPAKYLINQLQAFKSGKRASIAMAMYATDRELPADDLQDISNFLAEKVLISQMPVVADDMPALDKLYLAKSVFNVARFEGDVEMGEAVYAESCAKCHGANGQGQGSTPQLVGQYTEYLRLQIEAFQSGVRENKKMEKYIMSLTSEEIEALLAFLSLQDD